jgi:hypothetical protein
MNQIRGEIGQQMIVKDELANTISEDELSQLKLKVEDKVNHYKILLNDKSALYEDLYSNSIILINRDQQIIKNETEIVQLKHEIDINILEIEQKTAIITEL